MKKSGKIFSGKMLKEFWGAGKSLKYKGKKYKVGKMSYGDYFFEPFGYTGGEKDPFAKGTLWLKPYKHKTLRGFFEIDKNMDFI